MQYLCALSKDLSLAVPIHSFSTYEKMLDVHGVGDCEQSFFGFVSAGFDFVDLMLPFRKRPLLLIAGNDDFFPYEGAVETYERLKEYGSNVELFTSTGGHVISETVRGAVYAFVAKNFGVERCQEPMKLIPADRLLVLSKEDRQRNKQSFFRKTMRLAHRTDEAPFRDQYADTITSTSYGFRIDGTKATVGADAFLKTDISSSLDVHFGVTRQEAEELLKAAGARSILAVVFDGEDAYRNSNGRGYDLDAIYFYLSVLCGAPIGAQRVMQGMKALSNVVEK